MVLILDGNSEHVAQERMKIGIFREKKNRFVTDLDLNKCLKQIEKYKFPLTRTPNSELPYNTIYYKYHEMEKDVYSMETQESSLFAEYIKGCS